MKANRDDSPSKDGRGLRLFIVLVAVLSIALGATLMISDDGDSDYAVNNQSAHFTYSTTGDEATITGLTETGKTQTELTIPATVVIDGKEYKVTRIDDKAFRGSGVVKMTIGDNVTEIGKLAFDNCDNLTDVVFGNNLKKISDEAFFNCTKIKEVILGDSVEYIGEQAFVKCHDITHLVIPENVAHLGMLSFWGCSGLKYIEFNAKKIIEYGRNIFQFAGDDGLTVVFGDTVKIIPNELFANNSNLSKVTIGKNVTLVGNKAFFRCFKLTEIIHNERHKEIPTDEMVLKPLSFSECDIRYLSLPNNITTIGEEAFSGNENLETVIIPGSVTTIENKAFGDCPNIDKFAFGDFDDTIEFGDHIFSYEDGSNVVVDYKFRNMDGKEYTFTDANVESGVFDNRAYDVDENGTALNVFALLLNANGGTCDESLAFTDENGVLLTPLPKPVRDGYTFIGWYDGDEKIGLGSIFTENTTLTAKWVVTQSTDITSVPLLILLLLAIIAVAGIALIPRKE